MKAASAIYLLGFLSGMMAPARGAESGPDQRLRPGRLPCADGAEARPHGWRQLAWEMMKRTSVEAELETMAVDPATDALFSTPLLLWSCAGEVAGLSEDAVRNLRRHLALGGFLFVDDPAAEPGGPFDRSVREALARILPQRPLAPIPADHVLYRTFFLIERVSGRRLAEPRLFGATIGDRLAVVFSPNDLLGATSRDLIGSYEFPVEPGGEMQREDAFRLGINVFFYALCLDYKNDRVHLPFILKRRRL